MYLLTVDLVAFQEGVTTDVCQPLERKPESVGRRAGASRGQRAGRPFHLPQPVVLEQLLGARPEGAEGWTVPSQARGPQCGHPASPRTTRPALTSVLCPVQVPDEHFSTLLAYLEGLRGQARELTVRKAEVLMRELDEAGASADAPLPGRTQRVRQVLQLLS